MTGKITTGNHIDCNLFLTCMLSASTQKTLLGLDCLYFYAAKDTLNKENSLN